MEYCPFCGRSLDVPLTNGISSCIKCGRTFDSSGRNRLLAAAWMARRENIQDRDLLRFRSGLSENDLEFIYQHIVDSGCTHDEFLKILAARIDNAA
jgi:uncharacterized membrane protein YvbJ